MQIQSPIPEITNEQWTSFVNVMSTAQLSSVSNSNALGMFELMPRRLADLGLLKNLKRVKKYKRNVWTGTFIAPLTSDTFLKSMDLQYAAFCASMRKYHQQLQKKYSLSSKMNIFGALAILHRAGPQGIDSWNAGKRFTDTELLYTKAQECY